jgi:hypothetical protein
MVQVAAYTTRSDAELAQTALTAAGIESSISADDAGGAYPFDLAAGARLLVDSADLDAAAAILTGDADAQEVDVAGYEQTNEAGESR